ncbi:MAG: DUF1080 domain-containing protein [Verrucomicrobiota bacterium]
MKTSIQLSIAFLMTAVWPIFAAEDAPQKLSPQFEKISGKLLEKSSTPKPEEMLLNTDPEPDLSEGFVDLYNGENLDGWVQRGAKNIYEAKEDVIVGTYVPPNGNSYLCTVRDDFGDFIFTVEFKWLLQGNSGIQFRSKVVGKGGVQGPQVELEEAARKKGWTGGVYAQGLGGFFYPLWLEAHEDARQAVKFDDWNRVTIHAKGDTVKTWVNGVPCAHFKNSEFLTGYFALQVHKAKEGLIHFRNIKVKEL